MFKTVKLIIHCKNSLQGKLQSTLKLKSLSDHYALPLEGAILFAWWEGVSIILWKECTEIRIFQLPGLKTISMAKEIEMHDFYLIVKKEISATLYSYSRV